MHASLEPSAVGSLFCMRYALIVSRRQVLDGHSRLLTKRAPLRIHTSPRPRPQPSPHAADAGCPFSAPSGIRALEVAWQGAGHQMLSLLGTTGASDHPTVRAERGVLAPATSTGCGSNRFARGTTQAHASRSCLGRDSRCVCMPERPGPARTPLMGPGKLWKDPPFDSCSSGVRLLAGPASQAA